MYRPNITSENMFDAVDAANNQNDKPDAAALSDAISMVGGLVNGTLSVSDVQEAIDMNSDPSNDWYTEDYAKAFKAAWESLFLKLTN